MPDQPTLSEIQWPPGEYPDLSESDKRDIAYCEWMNAGEFDVAIRWRALWQELARTIDHAANLRKLQEHYGH